MHCVLKGKIIQLFISNVRLFSSCKLIWLWRRIRRGFEHHVERILDAWLELIWINVAFLCAHCNPQFPHVTHHGYGETLRLQQKKKKTQHFRIVKCYRVYLNLYCFRILEGNRKNRQKHYASCHNETRNSETIFKALDHMVRHKSYVKVPGPRRDLSMIDEDSEQMNIELNRIWEQTLQHRICE